jgi:hypothetical protein
LIVLNGASLLATITNGPVASTVMGEKLAGTSNGSGLPMAGRMLSGFAESSRV